MRDDDVVVSDLAGDGLARMGTSNLAGLAEFEGIVMGLSRGDDEAVCTLLLLDILLAAATAAVRAGFVLKSCRKIQFNMIFVLAKLDHTSKPIVRTYPVNNGADPAATGKTPVVPDADAPAAAPVCSSGKGSDAIGDGFMFKPDGKLSCSCKLRTSSLSSLLCCSLLLLPLPPPPPLPQDAGGVWAVSSVRSKCGIIVVVPFNSVVASPATMPPMPMPPLPPMLLIDAFVGVVALLDVVVVVVDVDPVDASSLSTTIADDDAETSCCCCCCCNVGVAGGCGVVRTAGHLGGVNSVSALKPNRIRSQFQN